MSVLLSKSLVTILAVSLFLAGCTQDSTINKPKEPNLTQVEQSDNLPNIEVKEVESKSDKEIAEILFEKYIKHYKSEEMPPMNRIVDYKVKSVNATSSQSGFMADVAYDVKPFIKDSRSWVAGNGIDGPNGWIIDKSVMFFVQKGPSFYQITELGTGIPWKQ